MQRIREKAKQLRQAHHETKEDWYCGKFRVRGCNNASKLDNLIGHETVKVKDTRKKLSAWKFLQRFYTLTKGEEPQAIKRITCRAFFTDTWVLVYSCGFYVAISKGPDGMVGNHPVILYYSARARENYAIASASFDGHFTAGWKENLPKLIKKLRKNKEFFQSQTSQQEQIPL